jgi:lipopolysaccharide transport system permease protein
MATLNPVGFCIEQTRDVLVFGVIPNWPALGVYAAIGFLVMWFGFVWFQRTRRGFADVL